MGVGGSDDKDSSPEIDLPEGEQALVMGFGPGGMRVLSARGDEAERLAESLNKASYLSRYAEMEGELRHRHGDYEDAYSEIHVRFPINTLMDIKTARVGGIGSEKGSISRIFRREVEILVDARKPDAPEGDYCPDVKGLLPPGYRNTFLVPKGIEEKDIVISSDGTFLNVRVDVPESVQEASIRNEETAERIDLEPEGQRDMIVSAIEDSKASLDDAISATRAYHRALRQAKRDPSSFISRESIEKIIENEADYAEYMEYIAQLPKDQFNLITKTGAEHKFFPKVAVAVADAFFAELALREIEREEESGPTPGL
ncbi:MAG TPA: hypothetical protein DEA55_02650 [Rhodospirillaceae bacterium]|nr:hypothetical protein [Rhodospirillaceae bacterium]